MQTEADESAFGSREDKIRGCRDQRAAWDANVHYLAPVFGAVRAPLPRERRLRGVHGVAWQLQQEATEQKLEQQKLADDEVVARKAFAAAACSGVATHTRVGC